MRVSNIAQMRMPPKITIFDREGRSIGQEAKS
jgi:hypothetical protein